MGQPCPKNPIIFLPRRLCLHHPPFLVPDEFPEQFRVVDRVAEDGALGHGVDGLDDVILGEVGDEALVVLPQLKQRLLGASLPGQRICLAGQMVQLVQLMSFCV